MTPADVALTLFAVWIVSILVLFAAEWVMIRLGLGKRK